MDKKVKKLTILAMLSAIAFVAVMFCRIPVVLFLKYEPKDVIITIGGFLFGPMASVLISVAVSFVEMVTISDNGIIGFVMNVIASVAFSTTASVIYKRRRTLKGAVLGLSAGLILMTAVMLLWNYIMTPLYMNLPREDVVPLLLPAILPFNLIKAGLNLALTLLLYKPIVKALRKANLIEEREYSSENKTNIGVIVTGAFIIVTCVLIILIMNNII